MSTVKELLEDIFWRIPTDLRKRYGEPGTLSAMNRIYLNINRRYKPLEEVWTPDFSTGNSSFDTPDDFIMPFRTDPAYDYIDKSRWNTELLGSDKVFTLYGDQIHFNNVDTSTEIDVHYYSSGKTLVNKATGDLGDNEVNEPEWKKDFHQILLYGTCIELTNDYPMYREDRLKYGELIGDLFNRVVNRQAVTPNITGGIVRTSKDDPYLFGDEI